MWSLLTLLLSAHVHGEGNLSVAIEKNQLKIEFSIPGDEMPGLKKRPQSEADLKIFDAELTKEANEKAWFVLSNKACERKSLQVKTIASGSSGHFDYHREELFDCPSGVGESTLQLGFWGALPAIKKVRVLILKEQGQKSLVLKPSDSALSLR